MSSKYTGEKKRKTKFDSQYAHVPLVQSSPTDCGVSECNREASIMRRPWPTEGCGAMERQQSCTACIFGLKGHLCILLAL